MPKVLGNIVVFFWSHKRSMSTSLCKIYLVHQKEFPKVWTILTAIEAPLRTQTKCWSWSPIKIQNKVKYLGSHSQREEWGIDKYQTKPRPKITRANVKSWELHVQHLRQLLVKCEHPTVLYATTLWPCCLQPIQLFSWASSAHLLQFILAEISHSSISQGLPSDFFG